MPDSATTTIGTLVADASLRFTPSGQSVATFKVAINHRWKENGSNKWQEEATFMECEAWGSLAENLAASVGKGDRLILTGRLKQVNWEDKVSGDKRSKVIILCDDVAPTLRWASASVERNPRKDS